MGRSQTQLQSLLSSIEGVVKAYFQPPTNVALQYPCIIYYQNFADTKFAGNRPYNRTKRYQVTVIDQDPKSEIPDAVADLPMCTFDRAYPADNLNHTVFNLYF